MLADRHVSRLALAAAMLMPAIAAAQETAPPAALPGVTEADEIVVIARRREERLIDVPIAVSAFNRETLEQQGTVDLAGLQGTVPNLNLVQGRGSSSNANIFIRGVGQPDALQTFDPAVGIYVDGVYISRIQGALFNLYDVERVEVLRGPQGTLYGKNTIGGAVNIVSRKPDLDQLTGGFSAGYGRFDQVLLNGYVSAPLVTDRLALSLAAVWDRRDGIVTDPLTGRDYNDRDTLSARAILRAQPVDSLEIIVSGDYTRIDTGLTLGYPTANLTRTRFVPAGVVVAVPAEPYGRYDYEASTSFRGDQGQELDHWGVAGTLNWRIADGLTLTSITAYRDLQPDFFIDIDASQIETGDVFVGVDQDQFSQELQAKLEFDKLSGVFGLYYLQENIRSHQEAYADDLFLLTSTVPISFTRFIDDKQKTRSYAAFGQLTYDFTDQFSFTAGLRYTKETKEYNRFTITSSSFAGLNNLSFRFPDNLPAPLNEDDDASFDAWTPSFTLSFKPDPDSLIYASAARGFKSGGFNGRANSTADLTLVVDGVPTLVTRFEPETVWTYELGAKANLMDGRLRLSGNVFYSDYQNFQARVGGGITSTGAGTFPVLNAGALTIWGIEFEAAAQPIDGLTLGLTAGYLNAEYDEFDDGRRPPTFSCNPTGNDVVCEPAFAPEFTGSISAAYAAKLESGTFTFGGEGRLVTDHFLSVDNRRPGLYEDGYAIANLFAEYRSDAGWYGRFNLKNAFGALYKTDGQEFSSVGNIQTVYYGDPRTWLLTVGFDF